MNLRKKLNKILLSNDINKTVRYILSFTKPSDKILDLGSGTGVITKLLRKKRYKVTPVDVKNRSRYKSVYTTIYDGKHLPFKNNQFDLCILISVLHHTQNPENVLKEAIRVSKKLVVYEDAITNIFQGFYTHIVDAYFNKELVAPHSNKSDEQWRTLFKQLKLHIIKTEYEKTWLFLHNPIYFLER